MHVIYPECKTARENKTNTVLLYKTSNAQKSKRTLTPAVVHQLR